MARGTRQRMIDSAVLLLREQGTGGTTIDAVLAHAGAPRGSVYYHFPGGRRELLLAAADRAGTQIAELITERSDGSPLGALVRFAALWRDALTTSGYRAGCPIAALLVDEASLDDDLAAVARRTVETWVGALAVGLRDAGLTAERADRRATLILATVEGALLLCRSQRSAEPLDTCIDELGPLLSSP